MERNEILSKVDHTLLAQTATWAEIRAICDDGMKYHTASVCIPASYVKQAKDYVGGKLAICTVIGFPNGYDTTKAKCFEAADAVENGADEAELECVFSVELPEKERSLYANLKRCLQIFGGRVSSHSVSEGWTPSEVSPIREKMVEAFVQLYGRKPFIKVSHGGNDCVKLVQRIPNLDAVTCAADCINHHTPREYLPMDTFERMLALVVRTLQLLAEEEDV